MDILICRYIILNTKQAFGGNKARDIATTDIIGRFPSSSVAIFDVMVTNKLKSGFAQVSFGNTCSSGLYGCPDNENTFNENK